MPTFEQHINLAREKLEMMEIAYREEKMSVVADLAVKVVEQVLQAMAARQSPPRHFAGSAAHGDLRAFARSHFPHPFNEELAWLYRMYESLGYGGAEKERAERIINVTYGLIQEVGKIIGVDFQKPTVQ